MTAPGWTQRLSLRGKLARALVVALTLLVALLGRAATLHLDLAARNRALADARAHRATAAGSLHH